MVIIPDRARKDLIGAVFPVIVEELTDPAGINVAETTLEVKVPLAVAEPLLFLLYTTDMKLLALF